MDFLQLHPTSQSILASQNPYQPGTEIGGECKRDEPDLLGDTPQSNYQQTMAVCRHLLLHEIAKILQLDCKVHIINHHIIWHLQNSWGKIHDPGHACFH